MATIPMNSILVHHFEALKVSDDHQPKCDNKLSKNDPPLIDSKKNDIYVIQRKEAQEMARSASQHFKLSVEAYQRGEHLSAKQHSVKAKEELDIARELNSKAAIEILKFNNRKNNIWRIDLHGLHASEAVQALQDRLHKIESEGSEHVHSTLTKPVRHLLVITGVGKHSRGKPVLPTTVKSFLDKYSFRFEETRPGVLKVWPNTHHL